MSEDLFHPRATPSDGAADRQPGRPEACPPSPGTEAGGQPLARREPTVRPDRPRIEPVVPIEQLRHALDSYYASAPESEVAEATGAAAPTQPATPPKPPVSDRSEEHTSELQSP